MTLLLVWKRGVQYGHTTITGSDKRTNAILTHFGAGSSEYEAGSVVCGLLIAERTELGMLPCSLKATSELRHQPNLFFLPSQGSTKRDTGDNS